MAARSTRPTPHVDRRTARRQATKAEIVAAAWDLVRAHGLGGLGMRDLGKQVGMTAQSIYSYFGSKNDIYDAMFREGYLEFASAMTDADLDGGEVTIGRDAVRRFALLFFDFCTSDPVRYQLLFQRPIPDFVPSDDSWKVAVQVYDTMNEQFRTFGISDPQSIDLWTAVMPGLTDQQISNDPGGDRWRILLDPAVDMVLREIAPHLLNPTTEGTRP
jgi:AcrR family transcriptional regulator